MNKADLAKILYRTAKNDVSMNGNGRILLAEVRKDLENPQLTAEQLMAAWKKHFPNVPIIQRTENIFLVDFGGPAFEPIIQ
jgi:hypothetical protein